MRFVELTVSGEEYADSKERKAFYNLDNIKYVQQINDNKTFINCGAYSNQSVIESYDEIKAKIEAALKEPS